MSVELELQELAHELRNMTSAAALDENVGASDLRRVLKFITKVLTIVDESFQSVYSVLVDLQFLSKSDINSGRILEIKDEVKQVFSRSRFHDAEEICSRLRHLSEEFGGAIQPIVEHLDDSQRWGHVFELLQEHEGRVIRMIHGAVYEIHDLLDEHASEDDLGFIREEARKKSAMLKSALVEFQSLRNQILGLSGKTGFLELTESDPGELKREIKIMIDKSDKSVTHGHRVTIGDGNTIQGSLVVAEQIQNSFNAADKSDAKQEVKETLKLLCTAVEEMSANLKEDLAKEVARDLETLVKEATSESPRKKWYQLSADGLLEAAKSVGELAKPVTATVGTLLALLT